MSETPLDPCKNVSGGSRENPVVSPQTDAKPLVSDTQEPTGTQTPSRESKIRQICNSNFSCMH